MLLSLAVAFTLLAPCHKVEQTPPTQAVRQSEPKRQQVDIEAALRERGVEVEFTGNQVLTRRELLDILSCNEQVAAYFVEGSAAEKFSEDDKTFQKLEYSLHLFTNLLRSRGYLQARVRDPRVEMTGMGRKLMVSVNEGVLYRVGKVEFKGAKLVSAERLAEMFPLKAGDVADGGAIYDFLFQKVKRLYADEGYIRYEADIEPTFTGEPGGREGVVDFLITLDEGKRFALRSVEFEGNARTPDGRLRPAILLREGKAYSQTLLDQSLRNLEATGLVEKIDRDRDVNYRINEELAEVLVRIKLKEKSSH